MDQDQDNSKKKSLVGMLPTELVVHIISFLSLLRDRVKLRYVSRWFRCVIDGVPSLWKEFVWPHYDTCEEKCLKEIFMVCGQHIKVLSFPNSRVPPTLVEMLQYCSNVQHLSIPSTKLDPEQLRNMLHHMGSLQALEIKVDNDSDIKQLLLNAGHLRELTIRHLQCTRIKNVFKQWVELQLNPPKFCISVFPLVYYSSITGLMNYATQLTNIPAGITAKFTVYNRCSEELLKYSPVPPFSVLLFEGSGQVTIPCVKLSDIGIQGLNNDVAVMTNCQYGERTRYMVRYHQGRP